MAKSNPIGKLVVYVGDQPRRVSSYCGININNETEFEIQWK